MKNTIIQGIKIDWNKIDKDSYLRQIPSLKNLQSLEFSKQVTFLWAKMEQGNLLCWKELQWRMDLTQKAEAEIIIFLPLILIQNCVKESELQEELSGKSGGIFCGQKVCIMC